MGAYCRTTHLPRHTAKAGEIMEVRWATCFDAALFGDHQEIACIPHKGCGLEIVATAKTSHREINLLLPGQVIRYRRSFFFGDRLELPSGARVGLQHFLGFKLQLAPPTPAPPIEEAIVERVAHGKPEGVTGKSPAARIGVPRDRTGVQTASAPVASGLHAKEQAVTGSGTDVRIRQRV